MVLGMKLSKLFEPHNITLGIVVSLGSACVAALIGLIGWLLATVGVMIVCTHYVGDLAVADDAHLTEITSLIDESSVNNYTILDGPYEVITTDDGDRILHYSFYSRKDLPLEWSN